MREIKVYLSEQLDKRFRKAAMDVYGYARGSISKAAENAFLEWCQKQEAVNPQPVNAVPIGETEVSSGSSAAEKLFSVSRKVT
jgi:hypothetical protein